MLQVLLNLLSNAAKFTSKGIISLMLDAREMDAKWQLNFTVQDSGIGIADAAQSRIFNAFTQLNCDKDGAGLGLYIAKSIVENMGGKLALESSADTGSRFSFSIVVEAAGTGITSWDGITAFEQSLTGNEAWAGDSSFARIENRERRVSHVDQVGNRPPQEACNDLDKLARSGQLSGIEEWLCQVSREYPQYTSFYQSIEAALQTLDLERIASLAQAQD